MRAAAAKLVRTEIVREIRERFPGYEERADAVQPPGCRTFERRLGERSALYIALVVKPRWDEFTLTVGASLGLSLDVAPSGFAWTVPAMAQDELARQGSVAVPLEALSGDPDTFGEHVWGVRFTPEEEMRRIQQRVERLAELSGEDDVDLEEVVRIQQETALQPSIDHVLDALPAQIQDALDHLERYGRSWLDQMERHLTTEDDRTAAHSAVIDGGDEHDEGGRST